MRRLLLLILSLLAISATFSQTIQQSTFLPVKSDSSDITSIKDYYHLALQYKNGDGVPMDYTQAFENFQKAADLGDAQGSYAVAYMHYKGLGCPQNYQLAAVLFAKGAYVGRDNSMYFYGLCFRNGYGLDRNEDSAKYWLDKAANLGYAQAKQELLTKAGENANDSAGALVQKIHNAALPAKAVLNEFRQVVPHIPSRDLIAGEYTGYLFAYDWSGRHIISNKALHLTLENKNNSGSQEAVPILTGAWTEKGSAPVLLKASLRADSLVFQDTRYNIQDHYSEQKDIAYDFTAANLNLVHSGDSVYLAGNVSMFSPDRKEPSKPLFIALVRQQTSTVGTTDSLHGQGINKDKADSSLAAGNLTDVKVYPNPFVSDVTVEFTVHSPAEAAVQLLSINGAVVYRKPKQLLQPGRYTITLSPGRIASGVYVLQLLQGSVMINLKVIHR